MSETKENNHDLVSGKALAKELVIRKQTYVVAKRLKEDREKYLKDGWEECNTKPYKDKRYVKVRRNKSNDEQFENRVWCLFARMGFTHLNKGRKYDMLHDSQNSQQIDVFAADNETVLIVECKAAKKPWERQFKKELEAFHGQMKGLREETWKLFPNAKIKFVWATQNYLISQADLDRMQGWEIVHMGDATINYYEELVSHLGTAARYQLQGNIFANQRIHNMEYKIPAIKGKMGGRTYYSFSITPERLLQIGYVLHRSEANKEQMPTYQRLIKKKRLAEVRNFVNNGGFFPNSLIINIDNKGGELQFERSSLQCDDSPTKIGILHLPRIYRSAYIIDGQHRLYGYSDSEYAMKDSIPVVAFVNLAPIDQVKLFKDINENQKAVPKTLRATLDADVLWHSPDYNAQRQALRSKIAQMLGEESHSPLKDKIIIGEDDSSDTRCITIRTIQLALKKCDFLTQYGKKNRITKNGTFDTGSNDGTLERLYPFLEGCFRYVSESVGEEWARGKADDGVLTINRGIHALLCLINDIVNHLMVHKGISPIVHPVDEMITLVTSYLSPFKTYFNGLSEQERKELKGHRGESGGSRFWRVFQKVVANKYDDFLPEGLTEYWANETKPSKVDAQRGLSEIESSLKELILELLEEKYGKAWEYWLPEEIRIRLQNSVRTRIAAGENPNDVSIWDGVTLNDCRKIAQANWKELFDDVLTRTEDVNQAKDADECTRWIEEIGELQSNLNTPVYIVSTTDVEFVQEILTWLREYICERQR